METAIIRTRATADDTPPTFAGRPLHPYIQTLNSLDRFELSVHELLRSVGQPGLKLQAQLWLGRRLDERSLKSAIDRLVRLHPVAAARLSRSRRSIQWWANGASVCPFKIHPLDSDGDEAVWRAAARVLSTEVAPESDPPLSFHLLRRPSAGDTLIVDWIHPLMDGKAGELLLRELNRLCQETADIEAPSLPPQLDEPWDYVCSFPRRKRWRAVLRVRRSRSSGPPVRLMRQADIERRPAGPLRLTGRVVDEKKTAALLRRARVQCGFPHLTPPLLASTFRALQRCTPASGAHDAGYRTAVPVNLRPATATQPIFRNMITYVRSMASGTELHDRDDLTRRLSRRMREQFARHADLGIVTVMAGVGRSRFLSGRLGKHVRNGLSLGYAYMGEMPEDLETFCGVPVEREYFVTSLPAPPDLGISASQCRNRLNISMTYISAAIPDSLANTFLDILVADLTSDGTPR